MGVVHAKPATPRPARRCCSAWWSVGQFGLSVALIACILTLLVSPWVHLPWDLIFRRNVSIASAISLWLVVKKIEGRSFQAYGLTASRAGKEQFLFGLSLGLVALSLLLVVGLVSGVCQVQITDDHAKLWRTVLGFIPTAVLVSVLEELVFRGVILQQLLVCSKPTAVIVSSALYAIVHLKNPTWFLSTYLELVGLFVLGSILALSYLETRQLMLAIGLHASLAYGARVNKLLVAFSPSSMTWLTGTSRLVNGVIAWGVLLGIGAVVMWWARSSQGGRRNEGADEVPGGSYGNGGAGNTSLS